MGLRGPLGLKLITANGSYGTKFVCDILGDYWAHFHNWKSKSHMKALGPHMCTGLIIFPWCPLGPEKGPWGPNLVQHICGRPLGFSVLKKHIPLDIRYMLVCHFLYGPKGPKSFSQLAQFSGFVDNFVSYAAKGQQSLWGHQVSC